MTPMQAADADSPEKGELEFFGVKLKVRNPRLAALLNSDVNDDVQVIGRRALDAFSVADDPDAEQDVERRLHADDSVHRRLDGVRDI